MPYPRLGSKTPVFAEAKESKMPADVELLRYALQLLAPGTEMREGLRRIQRSHTGALIVLGFPPEVEAMCSGGFNVDVPFSAARLRELCKMDGAVIVDTDQWLIRKANVQLLPDNTIVTDESGTRHRTAQRTARQTGVPVLSVSSSMKLISIYAGDIHYTVEEPEILLSRANQAVDTLDRYTQRLEEIMSTLSIFEMRGAVTIRDVATVVQRMEMIRRITAEINGYIDELGAEGRLLALQVDDLLRGAAHERALVLNDYIRNLDQIATAEQKLSSLPADALVDLNQIANILGLGVYDPSDLDRSVSPRGIQALSMVPRLPWHTIQLISERFPTLADLRSVTSDDLLAIEGIGPYRAQLIVDHLREREQLAQDFG